MPARTHAFKKLSFLPLAAVIFLTVSGGPYGLEPLLYYMCNNGALLLLVLVPLLWDVPTILAVTELNSMMPVTGGYYQWVKRALGIRWAFYEGWWTWLYTFVDLAIYPQLFILYATMFFPQIALYRIPVCICFIWACAGLNITGINPVGKASVLISLLVLIPFAWLFVWSAGYHGVVIAPGASKSLTLSLGMGLFTVMWNFIGWDNVTTYAEEVKNAARSYFKAMGISFSLVIILYLLTTVTAIRSGLAPAELKDTGYTALGMRIGGRQLGVLISAGGMVSSIGLFLAVLLSVSRVPLVMSADKMLPRQLNKLHPRYRSPYISIIVCSFVVSGMVCWTFGELLIIDITIYAAGLFLEFASLIVLRIKEPLAIRPFRIPFNIPGLVILLALPVCVYLTAIINVVAISGAISAVIFAFVLLLSAEAAWRVVKYFKEKQRF